MRVLEKPYVTPRVPLAISLGLIIIAALELAAYGVLNIISTNTILLWIFLAACIFYLTYMALFHQDALPLIFTVLFLTTYHSLLFNYRKDLPIAVLFTVIFVVYSLIMWLLLHYGTRLNPAHHLAYSVMSGFMIAQLTTEFATMIHDWQIHFEVASYIPTVFSYIFWRFACLSVDARLTWRRILQTSLMVVVLILVIVAGSLLIST